MKTRSISTVTVALMLAACTSTPKNGVELSQPSQTLSADEIRTAILDQTVSGVAVVPSAGRIPFKLFFSSSDNRYQDRVVVNGNVQRATGTFEITETGNLCRNSRSRNGGNQTCWQIERQGASYRFVDVSSVGRLKPSTVTLSPGLSF